MVHAPSNLRKKTESPENGSMDGSFTPQAHWSNRNTTTCSVRLEDENLQDPAPDQPGFALVEALTAQCG